MSEGEENLSLLLKLFIDQLGKDGYTLSDTTSWLCVDDKCLHAAPSENQVSHDICPVFHKFVITIAIEDSVELLKASFLSNSSHKVL